MILYHCAADTLVDSNCSRYHRSQLAHATLRILPGSAHGMLPADAFDAMMDSLHAAATRTPEARDSDMTLQEMQRG